MTYQRNIRKQVAGSRYQVEPRGGASSQQVLDEEVEEGVERAEVGGGDGYEQDRHPRGLDQRLAIRPLDPLELCPAGDEEADHAAALALGGGLARRPAPLGLLRAAPALALLLAPGAARDLAGRFLGDLRRGADVGAGGR